MSGRFSRLPAAAITDTALSDKTLRVLAAIGIYADEGGLAYPSVPTLAKILAISERQVQRHLRILESAGHIVTERTIRHTAGGWGRNRYFIQYRRAALPAAPTQDSDDQPEGTDPSGRDPKRTTGHGSANEREVTSRVSPRQERGDIQSVTTGPAFQPCEVTSGRGRGDISGDGEVTPWMSDKQPNESNSPMGNQPKGSRDVFEEMFSDLLPALRRQSSVELGAITIETEPAEAKLLGKVTELVENAEPSPEAPQPAEPAVPSEPLAVPPEPKPFDPAQYHQAVADKITRWCGVGIGQAWAFMLDLPDSTVVGLCRKVHDGKLRKADVTKALRAAQALKAQAAE